MKNNKIRDRSDQEWIRALKAREPEAIEDLWALLFKYGIYYAHYYHVSEDVGREGAVAAYQRVLKRGLQQYAFHGTFRGYCREIVVNEVRRLLDPQEKDPVALDEEIVGQEETVATGDINKSSDFVGRDKDNPYFTPEKASREDLLRAYYRQLANECRHLPLGTVDPKFARPTATGQVALHQVYVGLDVVAPVRAADEDKRTWGLSLARGEGDGRTPLLEALTEPEAARVVLLGDPGSGKSTFVNYLTYRLADAAASNAAPADLPADLQGLWPARLILREVARFLPPDACGTADLLWQALRADLTQRLGEVAAERLLPHLQARLLRRGWFLLDGLDEVPTAHRRRECLLEAIQALLAQQVSGRMLLTARPYAYADEAWQIPSLPILALAPFDEAQVNRFVKGWYDAVQPIMDWSPVEATARGEQLSAALQALPSLGDLASRPLLLTLMATLHTSWGQLPKDRADLYEESIKLLLVRWQRARTVRTPEGKELQSGITAKLDTELQPLRWALERLAYDAHMQQAQAPEREDTLADIPENAVLVALYDVLPQDVNARDVLPYLKHRAGLLLERRPGVYAFPHRSFQEYLAACHLAETEEDFGGRLRELIWDDPKWWREVFLLGVGKAKQGGLSNAVAVVNTLVPAERVDVVDPTPIHWRAASLAGEALLDLDLPHQAQDHPYHQTLLRRVRRWLVALVEGGHLNLRERVKAGDVLGKLGDPRPGVGVVEDTKIPDILWVEIPEGPFLMGSTESDTDAYGDEKPQHELTLPTYYIARYPVTNAQFRPFVEGDGYQNPAYWTEEGWAWRQGAEADLSLGDQDVPNAQHQIQEWLTKRPVEKRDRPFWWDHPQWGAPTRPVMGVTWLEAVAYMRWLEKQFQVAGSTLKVWRDGAIEELNVQPGAFNAQLPSEAEWEKAARGIDGRRYPWGDIWQVDYGNLKETWIEETNAVGCFPQGVSPHGVLGMSGNVWEWTRSLWGAYPEKPNFRYPYKGDDGRENLEAGMDIHRVLRGGDFDSSTPQVRTAYRHHAPPYAHGGFRIVLIAQSDLAEHAPSNTYHLVLNTSSEQIAVGQQLDLRVELAPAKPDEDTFVLPDGVTDIQCFVSADGLDIQGSEAVDILLDPDTGQPSSVDFRLRGQLCGERTYSINLFIHDPKSGRMHFYKTSDQVTVISPEIPEKHTPVLSQLDIRVAPRPDLMLHVETTLHEGIGSHRLTYYLSSRLPGLHLSDQEVGSITLDHSDLAYIQALLKTSMGSNTDSQPRDTRTRMISLGIYLFDLLFPPEETADFREILWQNHDQITTWLIVQDAYTWLPWELTIPHYESMRKPPRFLAEQYHLSRWISGLGPPLYHEVPMGETALVPYTLSEAETEYQEQRLRDWQALLKSPGFNSIQSTLRSDTPFYGMHLFREAESIVTRRDLVARCAFEATGSPEKKIEKTRLYSRLKRPVVTLSILKKNDVDMRADTDACLLSERVLPFLRAGVSAVVCPQWQTSEDADQVFWPTFYDLLARRLPLGEVMWRSRMAVQQARPDSFDWLAYTLFGDPHARAYWPEPSEGYAVLECLNPDTPLRPGKTYTFRASLRNRPPLWYTDRLIQPEALPEKLFALFLAPGIQSEVSDPIEMKLMGRTMLQATVDLTPPRPGDYPILAQLLDGDEQIKTLQLTLKVREEETASDT